MEKHNSRKIKLPVQFWYLAYYSITCRYREYGDIAQLAEQALHTGKVAGSSPAIAIMEKNTKTKSIISTKVKRTTGDMIIPKNKTETEKDEYYNECTDNSYYNFYKICRNAVSFAKRKLLLETPNDKFKRCPIRFLGFKWSRLSTWFISKDKKINNFKKNYCNSNSTNKKIDLWFERSGLSLTKTKWME